ncbi:MAG TPA: ABC transporter substrate-binding protein [Opitutales bacterium]|nr:ABC transporter substrate-binding protein [Opitutales bacterium]
MHTESDTVLDEIPTFPESEGGATRKLDFLCYAPCPIRHELQRRLWSFFREQGAAGKIEWFSPGGCGGVNDPYDTIWQTADADGMPGVLSDGGSSDYFKKEGHERWIASGVYGPLGRALPAVRAQFADAGIADPLDAIHIYGAFPSVFMVDLARLGDRPMPRSWSDLNNPIYKGDITISGWEDEVPDSIIFNMWKNLGEKALGDFARNVKNFWAPAQMVKAAGTSNPEGTPIYVLNHFFAKGCPRTDIVKLVWPEDGAWFNPLSVLAKRGRRPVSNLAIDYLFSDDWAKYLDGAGVPSVHVHPGQKPLPGKLSWIGWDFIRRNDIDLLRVELNRFFQNARK